MFVEQHKNLSPVVPSVQTPGAADSDDPSYSLTVTGDGNADAQFTAAVAPLSRIKDITQCQKLRIDFLPDPLIAKPVSMPFIDCDLNSTTINALIAEIEENDIVCGVFYSATEPGCMVTTEQEWIEKSVPNLFTVTTNAAALQIASMLGTTAELRATVSTESKTTTSGSSGGLIALYAALGVFAFILLILLVGGFIRILRHPERYNTDGTGEERARGLARAMLDSIPLVRVDSGHPTRNRGQGEECHLENASGEKLSRSNPTSHIGNISSSSAQGMFQGEHSVSLERSRMTDAADNAGSSSDAEAIPTPRVDMTFPAIISAPAPAKVNTYAFSGGMRTPQRTPGHTPDHTPGKTPGRTGQTVSASSPNADLPPRYSTDGFPFPIMHDNAPSSSLETIDEHKIASRPPTGRSTPQLNSLSISQSPMRVLGSPPGNAHDITPLPRRTASNLELPTQPLARQRVLPVRDSAKSKEAIKIASSSSSNKNGPNTGDSQKATKENNGPVIGVYVNQAEDACSICFEEFQAGELLRALPCGHYFHATCVDPWFLKSSSKCPLCRADLRQCVAHGEKSGTHHGLGHTFYFVRQRIRRVSESLRSEHRSGSVSEHLQGGQHGSPSSASGTTAPSLRRSHTTPAHRLLHLLPLAPSTAHLSRTRRQTRPDGYDFGEHDSNNQQTSDQANIPTTSHTDKEGSRLDAEEAEFTEDRE